MILIIVYGVVFERVKGEWIVDFIYVFFVGGVICLIG